MTDTSLPPSAPLPLTAFPNEILDKIIRETLQTRFRNSTYLASLSLVCRRFRDLVESHLYHTITLEVENSHQVLTQGTYGTMGAVSSVAGYPELFRTLTQRPSLRPLIRVLCLQTTPVYDSYHPDVVEHHLLILQLCPLLETLYVKPPPMYSDLRFLRALKSLYLDFSYAGDYFRADTPQVEKQAVAMNTLSMSLGIPNLRKITTRELLDNRGTAAQSPFKHDHRASCVTGLHLLDCSEICSNLLRDITLSLKRLESLIVECRWSLGAYRAGAPSLSGIDHTLQPHQGSLRELIIAASYRATMKTTEAIDSLIDYTALKRLAIPEHVLLPSNSQRDTMHHLLPSSLCELQIEHVLDGNETHYELQIWLKRFRSLANNKYTNLPALQRVIWWYQTPAEARSGLGETRGLLPTTDAQGLVALFRDVGVQFEWGATSEFLETPFGKESNVPFWHRMDWCERWNTCCKDEPESDQNSALLQDKV